MSFARPVQSSLCESRAASALHAASAADSFPSWSNASASRISFAIQTGRSEPATYHLLTNPRSRRGISTYIHRGMRCS